MKQQVIERNEDRGDLPQNKFFSACHSMSSYAERTEVEWRYHTTRKNEANPLTDRMQFWPNKMTSNHVSFLVWFDFSIHRIFIYFSHVDLSTLFVHNFEFNLFVKKMTIIVSLPVVCNSPADSTYRTDVCINNKKLIFNGSIDARN